MVILLYFLLLLWLFFLFLLLFLILIILIIIFINFLLSDFFIIKIFFWIHNFNQIRELMRNSSKFSLLIIWFHDFYFNSHDSLFEKNMPYTNINKIPFRLTCWDHVASFEFHCFCSLLSKLSRNNNFTSLGLISHDCSYNTHSCKSDRYFF